MLSDYRVIVLGVHEGAVSPGLRNRLVELGEEQADGRRPLIVRSSDITRVLGASLAVNGAMEGHEEDKPGRLFKTLAFANSIPRSKFFSNAMKHPQVLRATTRRLRAADEEGERAMRVESQHLDASSSALERNRALRELDRADSDGALRLLCNVRLFSEGVDVPSLDAVAFMEPRDSQVDVVQAVGRVMRQSEGKRFGYIVVPVPVEPRGDVASALAEGSEGYRTLGRVLRALQAHDERLAEDPLRFVTVHETPTPNGGGGNGGGEDLQEVLDLRDVSAGLYAQVVAASGLGRPGLMVSQDIEYAVKAAARRFEEAELEETAGRGARPRGGDGRRGEGRVHHCGAAARQCLPAPPPARQPARHAGPGAAERSRRRGGPGGDAPCRMAHDSGAGLCAGVRAGARRAGCAAGAPRRRPCGPHGGGMRQPRSRTA